MKNLKDTLRGVKTKANKQAKNTRLHAHTHSRAHARA